VKLFISYPSDQHDLCERLRLALEAEGHEVFTDRAELKEGEPYHEALRKAIGDSDAMVFVITPRAVAHGSYALTELEFAERRWRVPGGHVLPVLVEPTPIETIPPYLRSVTLLQPQGDVVAETVAAVARMRRGVPLRAWLAALAVLLVVGAAAAFGWYRHQLALERERAQREQLAAEQATAAQLCSAGSHAVGWDQFARIAADHPGDEPTRREREDCGMRWLREMRVSEKETFGALVAKIQPVLAQGLARSSGERRADLRAHLGWAEFLRSRDGAAAADPLPQYQAALIDDPGNVYAHAMWAHNLVWARGRIDDESLTHYASAARSPREHAWLRGLQFASAYQHRGLYGYAWQVANDMRVENEALDRAQRDRLWRYLIDGSLLFAQERADLLKRVSPGESLATFEWLFPAEQLTAEQLPLRRFVLALLQANTGQRAAARLQLELLQKEFVAAKEDSRLSRAVSEVLTDLRKTG